MASCAGIPRAEVPTLPVTVSRPSGQTQNLKTVHFVRSILAGITLSPFVDGLEFEPTTGAFVEAGHAHDTLLIAFDDRLVTGGAAMVTFADGSHVTSIPAPV